MSEGVTAEIAEGDTFVVSNAEIKCSFGKMTSVMDCPGHGISIDGMTQLNVMDYEPEVHIKSFELCNSPNNPEVIQALSQMGRPLAEGEFPPVPCVPVITAPWINGKGNKLIGGAAALVHISTNTCLHCGEITIVDDGQ